MNDGSGSLKGIIAPCLSSGVQLFFCDPSWRTIADIDGVVVIEAERCSFFVGGNFNLGMFLRNANGY